MSLQLAAQHLSNQGRGPDDTLVHMSRNEVKSLNDLAMAHGGQLTTNPQTGLPEAGFLSSILPMVAGVALNAAFPGLGAAGAGLLTGAGSMMLNPKAGLMGGLMAGLGAYGGYGLGGGLAEAGVSSESGLTGGASNTTALENAKLAEQAKLAEATKYTTPNFQDVGGTGSNYLPTGSGGLNITGNNIGADFEQMPGNMPQGNLVSNPLTGSQLPPTPGFTDRLANMGSGISSLVTDPTADKFKALGGGSYMGLAKNVGLAAAPAIAESLKPKPLSTTAVSQKQVVPHYSFTPGMVNPTPAASATGVENTYFQPKYTALTNEQAQQMYPGYPSANFAGGGPVEQMSNNAAIGANTMYPMANMSTSAFATPYQDPKSTNMLAGMNQSSGGTVDPMSGEPNMQGTRLAGGGVSYDPQTQTYASLGNATSSGETPFSSSYSNIGNPTNTGGGPGSTTSTSSGPAVGTGGYSGYASPVDAATAQQGTDSLVSLAMPFGIAMAIADAINGPTASPVSQGSVTGTSLGSLGPASEGPAPSSVSNSDSAPSAPSDGGAPGMGGDARGGYLSHGRFDQRPRMATGGVARYGFGGFLGDSLSRIGSAIGHIGKSDSGGDPNGWAHLEEMMGMQRPKQDSGQTTAANVIYNPNTQQYQQMATGGISDAGYNLGGYSDGGRLLRGPGDGVSDSIPATIGHKQPARLADGEFVVPARIVSELGNGSTEAGARKLYAMMDRIQSARGKTVGKGKVAKNSRADKYLPA